MVALVDERLIKESAAPSAKVDWVQVVFLTLVSLKRVSSLRVVMMISYLNLVVWKQCSGDLRTKVCLSLVLYFVII